MENIALDINKTFSAPLEKVWQAWTDAEHIKHWFSPGAMQTIVNKMEVEEGGAFSITMKGEDKEHTANGVYKSIKPMTELSMTFSWEGDSDNEETLIIVTFSEEGDSTKMHFRHEKFATEKFRDMHVQGWSSSVEKLEKFLS